MVTVIQSNVFTAWLRSMRDKRAQARIASRISRLEDGNPGDVKPVGEGLSEMRIDVGQGYRIYFVQTDRQIVVLLCGGDKGSQRRDIEQAKRLAGEWRESQ